MMTDNTLANFGNSLELLRGGDTGKRGAEHRSFNIETGQKSFCGKNRTCASPKRFGRA